jgi:uncharacterized protein YecT (DUF1311 family)
MTKLPIYCLLSVTALSVNAGAKSDAMRQEQAACGELSSYSHIAGCHQLLLEKSDTLLNGEYKWVKFRDADCFFSDPREQDSSIASANRAACLADRTIERLKHVEDYSAPWNKGCNGCPW